MKRFATALFFSLICVCLGCTPVQAQTPAPTFFAAQYEHAFINSDLPAWTDWRHMQVQAYTDIDGGTLGLELGRTERFQLVDETVALDLFADIRGGAYANLKVRGTRDAEVLPGWDARLEVFQTFAGRWEGSLAIWHMDFPTENVNLVGAALARYAGNWYLRARALLSRSAGESAGAFGLSARRFLSSPRESVEFSLGTGKEVVVLGVGPVVDLRRNSFVQAVGQRFVTRRVGLSLLTSYNTFEGAPARFAVGIGLIARMGGSQ